MKKELSQKKQSDKKSFPTSRIDLMKGLNEKRLSLRDIRFGIAGSKNRNVKEQKTIKKYIARIYTQLNLLANEKNEK